MKFRLAFLIIFLFTVSTTFAQSLFSIKGTVKSEQDEPLESATVFLNGSTQITKTNNKGEFSFAGLSPGSYEVVVRMVGYASTKEDAIISTKSIAKAFVLVQKNIQLQEVVIGKGTQRLKHLATFFNSFIGVTKNAAFCKILNPEVIEFSTNGSTLQAYSDQFIIVENKSLGYKISYLLRDFSYDKQADVTNYDGECIFESLKGTASQQKSWNKNRLNAYKGSLMHYLRSLYKGNTVSEAFLTYETEETNPTAKSTILDVREFVAKPDKNFAQFKVYKQLKIIYAIKAYDRSLNFIDADPFKLVAMPTSYLKLYVPEVLIDKKGSYQNYKSFRLEGIWGINRLGDQLPFEYTPDKK